MYIQKYIKYKKKYLKLKKLRGGNDFNISITKCVKTDKNNIKTHNYESDLFSFYIGKIKSDQFTGKTITKDKINIDNITEFYSCEKIYDAAAKKKEDDAAAAAKKKADAAAAKKKEDDATKKKEDDSVAAKKKEDAAAAAKKKEDDDAAAAKKKEDDAASAAKKKAEKTIIDFIKKDNINPITFITRYFENPKLLEFEINFISSQSSHKFCKIPYFSKYNTWERFGKAFYPLFKFELENENKIKSFSFKPTNITLEQKKINYYFVFQQIVNKDHYFKGRTEQIDKKNKENLTKDREQMFRPHMYCINNGEGFDKIIKVYDDNKKKNILKYKEKKGTGELTILQENKTSKIIEQLYFKQDYNYYIHAGKLSGPNPRITFKKLEKETNDLYYVCYKIEDKIFFLIYWLYGKDNAENIHNELNEHNIIKTINEYINT